MTGGAARLQPLLTTAVTPCTTTEHRLEAKSGSTNGRWSRMGETAGECAAVCCCCPCGMVDLLILAVYRLPAGLWRKKKRERLLRKKSKFLSHEKENQRKTNSFRLFYMNYDVEEEEEEDEEKEEEEEDEEKEEEEEDEDEDEDEEKEAVCGDDCRRENDAVDWDYEMWDRFYWTGFWRSDSQKGGDQ
ncbi:E3 ubiquitin-protein ligase SINA-like 2 [Sesamum indicum]|uniref:E3 ubiquitin-protein ligase SINA-like 2 n=1 Tax=Sesamum indicum TaxID=4182 RepID=A0A6I9TTW1_SESIN|nr:E3 ubiquitin-protein ligase SINA-like 2 [Sesamum indicum]